MSVQISQVTQGFGVDVEHWAPGSAAVVFLYRFTLLSLIAVSDSNLYGTTAMAQNGEIYHVTPSGYYQVMVKFPPSILLPFGR